MTTVAHSPRRKAVSRMQSRPPLVPRQRVQMTATKASRIFPVDWLMRAATQAQALETAIGVWSALASHPTGDDFIPEQDIAAWLPSGYHRRLQLMRLEKAGLLTIRRDPMRYGWHVQPIGMH
jgi:hypothetical protein